MKELMTIVEKLRNPSRKMGGALDENRTLADMAEAADVIEGRQVLNSAQGQIAEELRQHLTQANGLIRSFSAICDREGQRTEWTALRVEVRRVLAEQHQLLHPKF